MQLAKQLSRRQENLQKSGSKQFDQSWKNSDRDSATPLIKGSSLEKAVQQTDDKILKPVYHWLPTICAVPQVDTSVSRLL